MTNRSHAEREEYGMANRPHAEREEYGRSEDSLLQLADAFARRAAEVRRGGLPRDGLRETQYTPEAGVSNPATSGSALRWVPATPTDASSGASTNPFRRAEASAPVYGATQPSPSAVPAAGASIPLKQPEGSSSAAPVAPAPAYGSDMAPRTGPDRPILTPEGPYVPGPIFSESSPVRGGPPDPIEPIRSLDLNIRAEETMTGRLMFGVGINSEAGLVGSVVLDEQNFDLFRFPSSWEDIRNATAWRGAGQRFRLEAVPGTSVQRYAVTFQEPYLFNTNVSGGLSGYYYNRIYSEYDEQRVGGRVALGYQITHDLSGSLAYRGAKINITNPMDPTIPDFAEVVGRDLALHGFGATATYDKRDNPFLATQGHLIEATVEQVIGSFEYPRAEVDARKYFTLHERPDGSGRHVLSVSTRFGWSGDDTPVYDRFYAGGFSTIRGFRFRGASPHVYSASAGRDAFVGGDFQLLASVEYLFPITADDMIRGVVFCDSGTVEPTIRDWSNNYRVAPGFGLRICVPAMGPAPIALDFAFPVSWQPGDKFEIFSFFVGFGR